MNNTACLDGRTAGQFMSQIHDSHREEEHGITDDPELILSRPPKARRSKWRTPSWIASFPIVPEVLWLGAIVLCGIAVIIGLRDIGMDYGVIWAGDR